MILRKPYTFLIKHFRLIHSILTICIAYLLYKSYMIYSTLNEFFNSGNLTFGKNMTDSLFSNAMFILPWVIIFLLVVILAILFRKNKPKAYYFVNIAIFVATIFINGYLYNKIAYMEGNIITSQELKLAIDISVILVLLQLVSFIVSLIRSIGIDFKKFEFGKDLMELDINEEDNEEFEVRLSIDSNTLSRVYNKVIRYIKYFYLEHKLLVNISASFVVLVSLFFIFFSNIIYNTYYDEGEYFPADSFSMNINSSYITNKNPVGDAIVSKNKQLLVLDVSIDKYTKENKINLARTEIIVDKKIYYPTNNYKEGLVDLGKVYTNQDLIDGINEYLLVYEIPKIMKNKEIEFRYLKNTTTGVRTKNIKVKLNPRYLDKKDKKNEIKLSEEYILNKEILGDTKMIINSIEVAPSFINKYNFCVEKNDCYKSIEYIKPVLNTNYDKVLMKIDGKLILDEKNNTSIKNIYNVISSFGRIKYKLNNKTYVINNFTKVDPKKYKKDNVYYIEINKNVLESDEACLIIKIRDMEYTYQIVKKNKKIKK